MVRLLSDSSTEEGLSGAPRYGHVGTVGIPLARPLQGYLFVVREKCNHDLQMYVVGLLLWNTFAYWAILLCRGISPFADVNVLTAPTRKAQRGKRSKGYLIKTDIIQ